MAFEGSPIDLNNVMQSLHLTGKPNKGKGLLPSSQWLEDEGGILEGKGREGGRGVTIGREEIGGRGVGREGAIYHDQVFKNRNKPLNFK